MVLVESEQILRELVPDMAAVARIDRPGVIVTAQGGTVTRVFRKINNLLRGSD